MDSVIEYLLFIGLGLYLTSTILFFYLFIRTIKTKDGIGLLFLRFLTLGISLGSLTIFIIRILSEYGTLDMLEARAIAVINPALLVAMGLYLNYLFHSKEPRLTNTDIKNLKVIKKDVQENNKNIKIIKKEVAK